MSKEKKSTLSPEARAVKAAYLKQWRERNRERIAQYNLKYWEGKARKEADDAKNSETN